MLKKFNLREKRIEIGLTQEKLAELLDVTPEYISMLENGRKPVSAKMLKKFKNIKSPMHIKEAVNNGGTQIIGHGGIVSTSPQHINLVRDVADMKERLSSIEKLLIQLLATTQREETK